MGVALLLFFLAMLIWAGRFLITTAGPPLPGAPPDFLDILRHARVVAWGLVLFATTGIYAGSRMWTR